MASWIGLEILIPKHPWKSKIGLLQTILAAKRYVSFFWVTLYMIIQGDFFHWYPPKKLKYVKPRLGESTLT